MLRFRIYPEYDDLYFLCMVFTTFDGMRKFLVNHLGDKIRYAKTTRACMVTRYRGNFLGYILFCMKEINAFTIADEVSHATMAWADRKKILANNNFHTRGDSEELFAEVNANLSKQLHLFFTKRGLLTESKFTPLAKRWLRKNDAEWKAVLN